MSALYLKSLTLKGFKSFAQSTSLVFEPGITCVVGPNGSGKSNVVDALAWVMGEQGAKTLRGGKMEDVIFAGTATRGPLGRAEVQLTIDNTDGALPIEFTEVTISRTLFRNGASEYAINGETCRLLDLQELLSDTGLGREMHVIVGQGQLDTVLKASAVERRSFIEEAAGILKYRRRKEKTERKLEAMQANLTRLTDLATELRRQLKPLGRQAEIAQQAQQIAAVQRELRAKLYRIQAGDLSDELDVLTGDETLRSGELQALVTQLEKNRSTIAELESELLSPDLDQVRDRKYRLDALTQRARALEQLASSRLNMLETQVAASAVTELAGLEQQLVLVIEEQASAEVQLQASRVELQQASADKVAAETALSLFDADVLRRRVAAEETQRTQAGLEAGVQVAKSKLSGAQQQLATLQERLTEVTQRASKLSLEFEALGRELEDGASEGLRGKYESAQLLEQSVSKQLDQTREALHSVERERDSASARHAALNLTLDQVDGVKTLTLAKFSGLSGLLADQLKIETGYEAAIATALGALSNAVIVESHDQALAAVRYLKDQASGRVDFLITEQVLPPRASKPFGSLVSAASVVAAPSLILDILDGFLVADDLAAAESALNSAKPPILPIITRDGDLISRSLVRGGGKSQPSTIELVSERDKANLELARLARLINTTGEKLESEKLGLEEAKAASKAALAELQEHDAELAARAERVGRVRAQLDAAEAERQRTASEVDQVSQAVALLEDDLKQAVTLASQAPTAVTVDIDEAQRASLSETLEQLRQAELQVRIAIGAQQERVSAKTSELASLNGRIRETKSAIERESEAARARAEQTRSAEQLLELMPRLNEVLLKASAGAEATKVHLETERAERVVQLRQVRLETQSLESRQQSMSRDSQQVEIRTHELRLMLANLSERVMSDLGLTVTNLLTEVEKPDSPIETLERELKQIDAKIAQLGQFNPLALEEFKALEERHKYLNEQLEDLEKARADLRGIIRDLDSRMQQVFYEAFLDTQREFEKIFAVLFPGGTGSLSLTEPDDLLISGVEVSVRPVGKRIERMSLLSGGERSLAAVALLIAIFKARPSPFYVLDEVEAALDDSNLGRLLEVIESLRANSQLIIVTHQKRTMEIADALYGVSMRQDGISAVIGERLERAS